MRDNLGRRAGDSLCGMGVGLMAAGAAASAESEPFLKTRSLLMAARSRLSSSTASVRTVDSAGSANRSSSPGAMDGVSCGRTGGGDCSSPGDMDGVSSGDGADDSSSPGDMDDVSCGGTGGGDSSSPGDMDGVSSGDGAGDSKSPGDMDGVSCGIGVQGGGGCSSSAGDMDGVSCDSGDGHEGVGNREGVTTGE